MKITQEILIAPRRSFFHETSRQKRGRAALMTAPLNLLFVAYAIRTFSA